MTPAGRLAALAAALWRGGLVGAAPTPAPTPAPPTTTTTVTNTAWNWPVSNGDCTGYEEASEPCPAMSPCTTCTPVECVFGVWGQWSPADHTNCNQICERKRVIATKNNECGKGCSGPTAETKFCPVATCTNNKKDCQMGSWGQWSTCANDLDQQERTRSITPAQHNGQPCNGTTKQTLPCGTKNLPMDCEFTEWHDWTDCSTSCGQGVRTRTRRWKNEAQWGGRPCMGPIQLIGQCINAPCLGSKNCVASAWTEWVGCSTAHPTQKYRMRSITSPNTGGGAPCPKSLKETYGCPASTNACTFSAWGAWSVCPVTCGGGQSRRNRKMLTWVKSMDMSQCPDTKTQETQGCNVQKCNHAAQDCVLGQWQTWTACRPDCGTGMKSRKRVVTREALPGGKGCTGPLEELAGCHQPKCTPRDCQWGLWSQWGACTASCGGGTHQRIRSIKIKNRHGGKSCDEVPGDLKSQGYPWSQIAPCNVQSCNSKCVNGTWAMWAAWSQCSASCDVGFRSRRRDLAQVPNACGSPAAGPEDEIQPCKAPVTCQPTVDCQLSPFSQWSSCSASCFGVQERNRLVSKYPSGAGKSCGHQPLKEMRPCNPATNHTPSSSCSALPHHDCTMTSWSEWTDCPVSCGGGQHTRARRIIQPPSGGGKSCNATLTTTESCNTNKCGNHCVNCKWGQWETWGACSRCGGQRYRTRRVEQLPNHCGTACITRTAHETSKCPQNCQPDYWCTWAEWSAFTPCSGTCGNVTKQRQRSLQILRKMPPGGSFLFMSHESLMCAGSQFEVNLCTGTSPCTAQVCQPVNCVFEQWSEWKAPQLTGLCQRSRVIAKNNNECGIPCKGDLIDTKVCIPHWLKPQNCQLSNWGHWSHCPSMIAQKYKVRGVFRQAANGGTADPCTGSLRETVSCMQQKPPVNCGFTTWTPWGACTRSCNGGWRYRTRQANHPEQQHGGIACQGSLKEITQCNVVSCTGANVDCVLGPWSAFGVCFNKQVSRFRGIATAAAGDNGKGCAGQLEETKPCNEGPVDCKVSPWTPWDKCDLSCGGGQQNRHRTIYKHPERGGKACPLYNKETQGCNLFACTNAKNCILSEWGQWGQCGTDCGIGQQARKRTVTQQRSEGGTGCLDDLEETRPCGTAATAGQCPPKNCMWGEWAMWGKCSKKCGTGFRTRSRKISQPASPGGKTCDAEVMTESGPCATQRCDGQKCIDGKWGEWAQWGTCSATCEGGVQWRTRTVAVMANFCGVSAGGNSVETQGCNQDTPCKGDSNCEWGLWTTWSGCSSNCNGVTKRTRKVNKYGSGKGGYCAGALSEVAPCNPAQGQAKPPACTTGASGAKIDCAIGPWAQWGQCTRTCGGGAFQRSRTITQHSANGGKTCSGELHEVGPCSMEPCQGATHAVNCLWHDWQDWAGCDHCSGVQRRTRQVARQAMRGGDQCEPGAAVEARGCPPRTCNPGGQKYCVWGQWETWGQCSAQCGHGSRTRRRSLTASSENPLPPAPASGGRRLDEDAYGEDEMREVAAMRKARVAKQSQTHTQELAMAFAAGGASLFLVMAAMRLCPSRPPAGEAGVEMARTSRDPRHGESESMLLQTSSIE